MGTITVTKLSKAYKQYTSRWLRLAEWFIPYIAPQHTKKWILKDINFTVNKGEAVAIVGMNGAGKSTLLKLITGTIQPSDGSVHMSGKVAALLELGMGFHPDFTGRQNAYMAGQLLGYNSEAMHAAMLDIEAFAEIGDYIDQPVRVYSSGMMVRLAFSVATAYRPDILIVDEALSVGDAYFQHKSFSRIKEFREHGTTLLFVSHDKGAIQAVCDRAIVLIAGEIAMEGAPEAVMDYYNAMLADKQNQKVSQEVLDNGKIKTISGTGEVSIVDICLLDNSGKKIEVVDVGQEVVLYIKIKINSRIDRLVLGYGIKDRLGQVMYGTNTDLTKQALKNIAAGTYIEYRIKFNANLGLGDYSIQTALVSTDTHLVNNYEWIDLALIFNVINANKAHFAGCNWLSPQILIKEL
jgi:lipopolysaccharide transport system ATP-binding protein